MDYFVMFLLGVVTAVMVLRWAVQRAVDRFVDQLVPETNQATASATDIQLKIEFDQNIYFAYNTENNQFVCQGNTVTQLRQRLSEMFPGQTATIVDGDPAVLAMLQKELEDIK